MIRHMLLFKKHKGAVVQFSKIFIRGNKQEKDNILTVVDEVILDPLAPMSGQPCPGAGRPRCHPARAVPRHRGGCGDPRELHSPPQ